MRILNVRPRCGYQIITAIVLAASLCGCAGTIDTLTSRRFRERPFNTMFVTEDPVVVLETSQESDARVRAMADLREPKRHNGSVADQEKVLQLLSTHATADPQAVCRLAAIQTLARFEDPRASQILVTAYHNAPHDSPQGGQTTPEGIVQVGRQVRTPHGPISSFTPDMVATIQSRVLESLGEARSPNGLALLCEIAATPPKQEAPKTEVDFALQRSNQNTVFDLRLAALRALANYRGEPQAIEVCFRILKTETSSVALRSRAHKALEQLTGKSAPPDAAAWEPLIGGKSGSSIQ